MANDGTAGARRETRLLLATIAISVGMLLLLARFRFPEEAARQTVEPAPAPLERLAAQATFDELAGIMADLERRILPAITTLAGQDDSGLAYVPAVRITHERAVALMPGEYRVAKMNGAPAPPILMRDTVRELIVVQAPGGAGAAVPATGGRPGPRYVAVVEASAGALAVRPAYVGRTDASIDPRWSDPLLGISAVQQNIPSGAAVFSLDGAFIGLATGRSGRVTIVPASTLRNIAETAPPEPVSRADLPFEVQPLTPTLSRAAGTKHGVMISYVRDPSLPVSSGDVVQTIDEQPVTTVGGYQALVQTRKPGAPVRLEIIRRGEPLSVTVTALEADAPPAGAASGFGAVLRPVSGTGAEIVRVESDTPAFRAGLRQGDLIVALDGATQPDPDAVLRRFRAAGEGELLLITVHRDGRHRVVAVEKR